MSKSVCETADALIFPFRPNTPLYDLYSSQYNIKTGEKHFDKSALVGFRTSLSKAFSDISLQRNVIRRYVEEISSDVVYENGEKFYANSDDITVKIHIKDTKKSSVYATASGDVFFTSKFFEETLNYVIKLIVGGEGTILGLAKHAAECAHINSFQSASDSLFDVRYADEIINDIFTLVLVHELAHIMMNHHEIESPTCNMYKYFEYVADYVATQSYYDMKLQSLEFRISQIGSDSVMINPETTLSILEFAFDSSGPIDSAIADASGCFDKTEDRVSRLRYVFEPIMQEIAGKYRELNSVYEDNCRRYEHDERVRIYCASRLSRLPRVSND